MNRAMIVNLLAVVLAAAACSGGEAAVDSAKAAASSRPMVGGYQVNSRAFARVIEYAATVTPHQEVTLTPKVPGEVREVRVVEGDHVDRGQALIQLDARDFRIALKQARAQLKAAEAGLELAKIGLEGVTVKHERFATLRSQDAVPQSAFDEVDNGYRASAGQVKVAAAQGELARVAVEAARLNLGYTTIRAPFDGVVARRLVDPGTRVQAMPPSPLLTIQDTSRVEAEGAVAERDLKLLKEGISARVVVGALGEAPLAGTIDRIEPLVDPRTRTASVHVALDNRDGRLQPGMSCQIAVDLGEAEAPAVPDDAIIRSEVGHLQGVVYVLQGDRVERREVKLGQRDGDLVEIAEGLTAGETIVRGGQDQLRDGQQVTVSATEGADKGGQKTVEQPDDGAQGADQTAAQLRGQDAPQRGVKP